MGRRNPTGSSVALLIALDCVEPGLETLLNRGFDVGETNAVISEGENEISDFAVPGTIERPVHEAFVKIWMGWRTVFHEPIERRRRNGCNSKFRRRWTARRKPSSSTLSPALIIRV